MPNLMQAHNEWSSRPSDERFGNLNDMHSMLADRRHHSHDGRFNLQDANFNLDDKKGVSITNEVGNTVQMTHWAMSQLCIKLGIPKDFLAKVSPHIAESILKDRLHIALNEDTMEARQRMLTVRRDGDMIVRGLHGDRYERLWDSTVTDAIAAHLPKGWRNPVAFKDGVWGAELVPSGLYAGDRDMFAFFIDGGDWADKPVGTFDVDGEEFNRGFFTWNSEVGAKSFGWTSFMFRVVCGNNIVWGANNVTTTRSRHSGGANKTLQGFRTYMDQLDHANTPDEFAEAVRKARSTITMPVRAGSIDEDREYAIGRLTPRIAKGDVINGLELAITEAQKENRPIDGSNWFWLQGLTAVARSKKNADEKSKLETTAGEILLAR